MLDGEAAKPNLDVPADETDRVRIIEFAERTTLDRPVNLVEFQDTLELGDGIVLYVDVSFGDDDYVDGHIAVDAMIPGAEARNVVYRLNSPGSDIPLISRRESPGLSSDRKGVLDSTDPDELLAAHTIRLDDNDVTLTLAGILGLSDHPIHQVLRADVDDIIATINEPAQTRDSLAQTGRVPGLMRVDQDGPLADDNDYLRLLTAVRVMPRRATSQIVETRVAEAPVLGSGTAKVTTDTTVTFDDQGELADSKVTRVYIYLNYGAGDVEGIETGRMVRQLRIEEDGTIRFNGSGDDLHVDEGDEGTVESRFAERFAARNLERIVGADAASKQEVNDTLEAVGAFFN